MNARIGHVSSSAAGQGKAAWQPQREMVVSRKVVARANSNRLTDSNNTLSAFSVSQVLLPTRAEGGKQVNCCVYDVLRVAKQAGNRSFRRCCLSDPIGSCHLACRGTLVTHPGPNVAAAGDRPVVIVVLEAADGQRQDRLAVQVRAYFRVRMMRR